MSSKQITLKGQIQNARSRMFRKCFIKRRMLGTGLYESDWVEISEDVVKWGSVKKEVDASKVNSFKFSNTNMTFSNRYGKYNPCDDDNSLWYGYGDQQRTLVKIQVGFIYEVLGADGIWTRAEIPSESLWDLAPWEIAKWDEGNLGVFHGIISGDIAITGDDQIKIPVAPLTEVFRLFAATRLTGWTASLTASGFIEMLRDQVDSVGNYIFRPFFGDTTTGFVINTTTSLYTNLNTSTAEDLQDATVWDVIEKMAEAENFVPYVSNEGVFNFVARDYNNSSSVYSFYGAGGFSTEFGQTLKKISWYGKRYTKYYSRVSVQFNQDDTTTSYAVQESTFRVSGDSSPWTLGERTLDVSNFWIPSVGAAEILSQQLFEEYSALRREIEFTTSLVPYLDLLNRVDITYDPTKPTANSLWDAYDWGNDLVPIGETELIWDGSVGDALKLLNKEFRLVSIDLNLDTGESKFIGRE